MSSESVERLRRVHNGEDVADVYADFPFQAFFYEADLREIAKEYFRLEAKHFVVRSRAARLQAANGHLQQELAMRPER